VGIPLIDELGRRIEQAWRAVELDRARFPHLCAEELATANLPAKVDPDDVVRAALAAELPQQADPTARFGQPPVTIFRSRQFYIDALFWLDATTAIHDHGFSGAFQVLSGMSIETTYSFVPAREIGGHVRLGDLRVQSAAIRRVGDVRPIAAGPSYIHALFHLVRPSVSLVVRTFADPIPIGQFDYSPAGIAIDTFLEDPIRDRTLQMIDALRKIDHPKFESWIGDLVATSDLHTAFAILRAVARTANEALVDRLVARLRDEEAARRMRSWLVHHRRIDFIVGRRATVHDPDLRFLMAVLMNAQNRADALALVAGYAPDVAPAARVAAWLRKLSTMTVRLQVGGAPFEPNLLGLPAFEPGAEQALADLLSGQERAWNTSERAFLERLRVLPCLAPLFV